MTTPRFGHSASVLTTGKVLIAGGRSRTQVLASAELYDPSSKAWTPTGDITSARYMHSASVLDDGKVLVAGGMNESEYFHTAE